MSENEKKPTGETRDPLQEQMSALVVGLEHRQGLVEIGWTPEMTRSELEGRIYEEAQKLRGTLGSAINHLNLAYILEGEPEKGYGSAVNLDPISEIGARAIELGKQRAQEELSEEQIIEALPTKAREISRVNQGFRSVLLAIVRNAARLMRINSIAQSLRVNIWESRER